MTAGVGVGGGEVAPGECQRGPAAISLNLDTGSRISLARSAMGRAYVAICPERERSYSPGVAET